MQNYTAKIVIVIKKAGKILFTGNNNFVNILNILEGSI